MFFLWLDDMFYSVEMRHINDLAANMVKLPLSALWLKPFFNRHLETIVKLVTHINQQRKAWEKPELFHYYFAKVDAFSLWLYRMCLNISQSFKDIIENDMKQENIYNINEKDLLLLCNKDWHDIVRKSCQNPHLGKYNSQELDKIIESIYAEKAKLPPFIIFRESWHCIGSLIHIEKEDNPTLAN